MNKVSNSVKSAAVATVLAAMASAPATAGETTTQTGFAAIAQLPVTALPVARRGSRRRGAGGFHDEAAGSQGCIEVPEAHNEASWPTEGNRD